jgi:thiol-disulfide isomerase/thioredoxin
MDTTTDQAEVLFFTSPHCPACKAMRPIADSVADRFDGTVRLTEVDSSTDSVSSPTHRVRGVPTFVAIHNGTEVARAIGSRTPDQLSELFAAAEGGDRLRSRISPTDRAMRLGVGAVFAVAAVVASTPVLWIFAATAVGFATWDLVRP